MIALLKGLVAAINEDHAIIDVGGVGYRVFCSVKTLRDLPGLNEAVTLSIETHVREDHIHLFGFGNEAERDWFRLLQSVQGVGARLALAILGTLGLHDLSLAVLNRDKAMVARTSGVGPKLAQRIVTELKDKVPANISLPDEAGVIAATPAGGVQADAASALINLGYGAAEADRAVAIAAKSLGDDATVELLIRDGLKELAK